MADEIIRTMGDTGRSLEDRCWTILAIIAPVSGSA